MIAVGSLPDSYLKDMDMGAFSARLSLQFATVSNSLKRTQSVQSITAEVEKH
jgi:hypothetical protein